jgi:hypothetical protein
MTMRVYPHVFGIRWFAAGKINSKELIVAFQALGFEPNMERAESFVKLLFTHAHSSRACGGTQSRPAPTLFLALPDELKKMISDIDKEGSGTVLLRSSTSHRHTLHMHGQPASGWALAFPIPSYPWIACVPFRSRAPLVIRVRYW